MFEPEFLREEYLPAIDRVREVGMLNAVASMIANLDGMVTPEMLVEIEEALANHRAWLSLSSAYEAVHGPGVLVKQNHSLYVSTIEHRLTIKSWS